MSDIQQPNSDLANSELASTNPIGSSEVAESKVAHTVVAESNRRERRRLIRAAVASVPVVLTFTAGKARAQEGTIIDSALPSPDPDPDADIAPPNENNVGPEGPASELTPAEKLETFGLQRSDRPEGYSEDPFRDLDTVSEPVDLND